MRDKVCLVTGATDGIGRVTAESLARQGAHVIAVGRNSNKGDRLIASIHNECGAGAAVFERADLASQSDIRALAQRVLAAYPRLDVLVNNAGGYFARRQETPDGLEWTFALNHLGYFLLTGLLLHRVPQDGSGRIVNVSSGVHRGVTLDFDDLQGARHFSGWRAYQRSKLANVMFTYALHRRVSGHRIAVNCLHPGFVATKFGHNNSSVRALATKFLQRLAAIDEVAGARTNLYLASSQEVAGVSGKYFYKCRAEESSAPSREEDTQERLWHVSEALTEFRYDIA